MGGQGGIKSVWFYSVPETGDTITSARAYTIYAGNLYKIEFLIDPDSWTEYTPMFDEIIASFQFINGVENNRFN